MTRQDEDGVYDSAPQEPDDDFWLKQGRKMVEGSLPAVREGAKAMMTALGVLQGIYVAILGFGETAKDLKGDWLLVAALPLVAWMVALFLCLRVMMTGKYEVLLHAPESVRENQTQVLTEKQKFLWGAFYALAAGLLLAFVVLTALPRYGA